MPCVNDLNHKAVIEEATALLCKLGYHCESTGYHDALSDKAVEMLRGRYDLTSLAIRTRADQVAIGKATFLYEGKSRNTFPEEDKRDIWVEALPYLHHLSEKRLGVLCVYFYANPGLGQKCAFVAGGPIPSKLVITSRATRYGVADFIERGALDYFGNNFRDRIKKWSDTKGSNDPFFLFNPEDTHLITWEECVDRMPFLDKQMRSQ